LFLGCSRSVSNIDRTYRTDARRAQSRASSIVFVPGIMGVELLDSRDGRSVRGRFLQPGEDGSQICEIAFPYAQRRPVSELRDAIVPGGYELLPRPDDGLVIWAESGEPVELYDPNPSASICSWAMRTRRRPLCGSIESRARSSGPPTISGTAP